ncbi:hypothetical protein [Hornefia butyriciproducens]|uniref:hypothetical protein n=1 Tax=Hornefia butyriciproducens TaxID=2652293 RepID=UPI003F8CEFBE
MAEIFRRRGGKASLEQEDSYRWRDGAYLCTVTDSFQADILESKLRSENIPCEKKYVGSSNYLEIVFGTNTVGEIELYVPAECLEDARNVIVPVDLDDCEDVSVE